MAGPFVVHDYEHALQVETTYDTEPDAPAAGDFARFRTRFPFTRVLDRVDRDQDSDNTSSVHTVQAGRESSTWELEGAVIPAGTTPTAPDMGELFRAHLGTQHVMTTNTSTTTGSSGTVINLATGGVVASGVTVADMIAMDVSATVGLEVRAIAALPGSDTIHVDRAFSSASPASGRTVYGSATYYFTRANELSLQIYSWLSGDNFRQKVGGAVASDMELSCDFTGGAPELMVKFSGPASRIAAHTNARPTPTLAGQPLVIDKAYVWFGANKHCLTSFSLKSNNALELRNNESCAMYPTGTKRTGNGGRYQVTLELEVLLETGTIEGYFDAADGLTPYDLIIQLGATAGKTVGIRIPKFVPDTPPGEVDGQVSLKLTGRCYGNGTADTEYRVAFL